MEAKPVPHSESPAYPTRREVLAGAASFVLLGLAGRSLVFAESEGGKIKVAPIFKHGDGRGATGCVVVMPPAFLSEEEALQVVKEELAKHGIQLAAGRVLKDLKVAPRRMQVVKDDEKVQQVWTDEKNRRFVPDKEHATPLRVTAIDENRSIIIKFVCRSNYERLGGVDPHNGEVLDRDGNTRGFTASSVRSYDFKDAAEYLAAEVKEQGKGRVFFAVFYDPLTRAPVEPPKKGKRNDWSAKWEERKKRNRDESEEMLRQQAQDFVAWLKEQKAIE
jgi:hypothetical protein